MIPTLSARINSDHRHPRITHSRGGHPLPHEAVPRLTDCADVESYVHECEARRSRGWSPHYPATLDQGLAAYRAGVSSYRPAEGIRDRAAYDRIDERRDWQRRYLAMLDSDPDFRAAVARKLQEGR